MKVVGKLSTINAASQRNDELDEFGLAAYRQFLKPNARDEAIGHWLVGWKQAEDGFTSQQREVVVGLQNFIDHVEHFHKGVHARIAHFIPRVDEGKAPQGWLRPGTEWDPRLVRKPMEDFSPRDFAHLKGDAFGRPIHGFTRTCRAW
jgi:hypothetical protein